MVNSTVEFESFEQQFLDVIRELQTVTSSESRLREALREESSRAEAAEAARDDAQRAAAEARSGASAAGAGAAHAAAALARTHDDLAATKMKFELAERHRIALEEKCSEMSAQIESLKRELQTLRPMQAVHSTLQRQYAELQERILNATQDARRESSRLETELRRVEKCASGGAEIRERARLAAAAHVRERRLAAAELHHTTHELHSAKGGSALRPESSIRRNWLSYLYLPEHNNASDSAVMAADFYKMVVAGQADLEKALASTELNTIMHSARINIERLRETGGQPTRPTRRLDAVPSIIYRVLAEVTRLGALVAELQCRLADYGKGVSAKAKDLVDPNAEALVEARAALEAERAGAARLERALAAALSDNATLAAQLHASDNAAAPAQSTSPHTTSHSTDICQIDSFLAE